MNEHALALDVGDKFVGLALAELNVVKAGIEHSLTLPTIVRGSGKAELEIVSLIVKYRVTTLVVGIPLSSDDQVTEQAEKTRSFIRRILRRCSAPITIDYEDEFLSTEEAIERLGVRPKELRKFKKRGDIDAMSASIILRRWIHNYSLKTTKL